MIRVELFSRTGKRVGAIELTTFLIKCDGDYEADPRDILTFDEVKAICKELSRLPQVNSGKVGKYTWREGGG